MSCRLAVTAGSWPGPPVSQPPGWPTTATSPSKAPCGTANWLIRRTTSDQSSLWETARERQPRFLVFFRPHQVSTRLWTRSWGQQASGAADPSTRWASQTPAWGTADRARQAVFRWDLWTGRLLYVILGYARFSWEPHLHGETGHMTPCAPPWAESTSIFTLASNTKMSLSIPENKRLSWSVFNHHDFEINNREVIWTC